MYRRPHYTAKHLIKGDSKPCRHWEFWFNGSADVIEPALLLMNVFCQWHEYKRPGKSSIVRGYICYEAPRRPSLCHIYWDYDTEWIRTTAYERQENELGLQDMIAEKYPDYVVGCVGRPTKYSQKFDL